MEFLIENLLRLPIEKRVSILEELICSAAFADYEQTLKLLLDKPNVVNFQEAD